MQTEKTGSLKLRADGAAHTFSAGTTRRVFSKMQIDCTAFPEGEAAALACLAAINGLRPIIPTVASPRSAASTTGASGDALWLQVTGSSSIQSR